MSYYALVESSCGTINEVLGVFDKPEVGKDQLEEYYGEYEYVDGEDVRDSGIEWTMTIRVSGMHFLLTMLEFEPNKILQL